MSTPNPLAPQGSLLEQHGRGRSTFQIISFIGGLHVVFLCGLLWIGCKKEEAPPAAGAADVGDLPPVTQGADPLTPPAGVGALDVPPPTGTGPDPDWGGVDPVQAFPPPVTAGSTVPPPPVPMPMPAQTSPGPVARWTPEQPAAVSAGASSTHKVAGGEFGTTIARKHGISLKALQDANPSVNWNRLQVGAELVIPAPASTASRGGDPAPGGGTGYTVQGGDTGLRIARKFGVSWKDIRRANNLSSDVLRIGQQLVIPTGGAAAGSTTGGAPVAVPLPPL